MNRNVIRFVFVVVVATFALVLNSSASTAQEEGLPPLKVVQLGDSYSAGNGARSASGDRNYHGVSGCRRSPTNWGNQFAGSLQDVFDVTYINRACSGGVIDDILNERKIDLVPALALGICPAPDYPDEEIITPIGFSNWCQRSLKPQIDAIDESVDLVIMTMGGNDVHFADIIKQCFVMPFRDPTDCKKAIEFAVKEMDNVDDRLIEAFAEIREELKPEARVVLVTYPHLVSDEGYAIGESARYPFGRELRKLGEKGDRIQREAVEDANKAAGEEYIVLFDGTKELFEGHLPDPLSAENPDRWLFEPFETSVFHNIEWYHFNPLGHQNLGRALSPFESFGAVGGSIETGADIDVVFVVDTTGSMGDEIAQVRADLSDLVDQLAATTDSYKVAVVSYRDFPTRTGDSIDYPFQVDQTFTDDLASIQAAIDALTAEGGGDENETVFSGIQAALELSWRPGVTKIAIVIGDAPALSPEPISNLTAAQIVANSIALDPVQVIGVDVERLNSNGALGEIAAGTGGTIVPGTSELTTIIAEILSQAAKQPLAWIGTAYAGKIGEPILFDASGSYDPTGNPITLYEWDFDSDGVFDFETEEATATHIYNAAFDDYVVMRVTSAGGTALASARTVVNAEGFVSQGDEDICELDENGFSIIVDENGQFISCTPNSLPEVDTEESVIVTQFPDLVVRSVFASDSEIKVEIENQGTAAVPAGQGFWVDLYVDPSTLPTQPNQIWNFLANEGLVWGVDGDILPMEPGEVITLTLGDALYWPDLSKFSGSLPVGTPIYVQVDSANTESIDGGVLESHEATGDFYNNVMGPTPVRAATAQQRTFLPLLNGQGQATATSQLEDTSQHTLPMRVQPGTEN